MRPAGLKTYVPGLGLIWAVRLLEALGVRTGRPPEKLALIRVILSVLWLQTQRGQPAELTQRRIEHQDDHRKLRFAD